MKSIVAATLFALALPLAATAQTPPAAKRVVTIPIKPAETQTPADTAKAMAAADRLSLQSDLAWVGSYNGLINGESSDRLVGAIKSFQKDNGGKQTGVLNPQERGALAAAAKALSDRAGWKIGFDPINGIRLGLPIKLAPVQTSGASGTKWSSAQGQIQIETWRTKDTNLTLAAMADREAKEQGRKVEYRVVNAEFFVLSGMQNLKHFYVRGAIKGNEVRGLTILYDQATEGMMGPVAVLMSSAFTPFPAGNLSSDGPAPRKVVEYSTGVIVNADGSIVADRLAVDGCQSIVIPALGNADRIAEDKPHDLALLRVYGATGLKPLAIASGAPKSLAKITGIADPQSQGGGSAVSTIDTTLTPLNGGPDFALQPAPGVGFSGAAVIDSDGKFAGIAQVKAAQVAGTPAAGQAMLISADSIRELLAAQHLAAAEGATDAKAAIVRVICIRK